MRKLLQISRLLLLILVANSLFISKSIASCNTPKTIISTTSGNYSSTTTWVGGVVPEICDFVIIAHNVKLVQSITLGQNGTGGMTILSKRRYNNSLPNRICYLLQIETSEFQWQV